MKKIGKGLWIVLLSLGVVFTPGLFFVSADGANDNTGSVGYEQNKDKNKNKWITASCDINPHKLNLKSKGKWITAYIELPENYDVSDIILGEILLNNLLSPVVKPFAIGDRDNNGILDLMIKFDRSEIIDIILLEPSQSWEVEITGKLIDGLKFQAPCTIELLNF
ncbi:MAG: hypothetical protein ACFFD7_04390 [Candidatus Thorarchaeota archaeon]